MIIDEKLANGLKNRFFLEISEEIDNRFESLFAQTRGVKNSRTGWDKLVEKFSQNFDRCALVVYVGGSKRKPYFGISCLTVVKERPFNTWNEKCLNSFSAISNFEPRFSHPSINFFNVGEHAIARLFQRGKLSISNQTDIDIYSIIPKLSLIPVWSAYWVRIIAILIDHEITDIRPVIPCEDGLFLAQVSIDNKIPRIEIRTFVDNFHLSELQSEVKDIFLKTSEGIRASPLVFFPANDHYGIDSTEIQLHHMSFRIKEYRNKIAKVFFHHLSDEKKKNKSISLFNEIIDDYAYGITNQSDQIYWGNIRQYHATWMKLDRDEFFNSKS